MKSSISKQPPLKEKGLRSIGTRLGLGIGTLLGLCLLIGLVSYTQTRTMGELIKELAEVKEPVNSAVYALENNLVETGFSVLGYLAQGDRNTLEAFRQADGASAEIRKRYAEVEDLEKDNNLDKELHQQYDRYGSLAHELIRLKNDQTQSLESLFKTLNEIDGLLTKRIQASIKADDPLAFRRLQTALEMGIHLKSISNSLGSFLITGRSEFETHVNNAERDFRQYFKDYQYLLISSEEKEWAEQLRNLSNKSLALARKVLELEKTRVANLAEFLSTGKALDEILSKQIQTRTEHGLEESKRDVLLAGTRANVTILVMLFLALSIGIYTAVRTTKHITVPLQRLVAVMNAIAGGDHTQRADITSSTELASLSKSFNQMTGRLVHANEELRSEILERQRAEDARRLTQQQLSEAERQRMKDLRRFAISVQRAQEDERQRISRELHDDLCQRLSGIKLRTEVLEGEVQPANRRVQRGLREFKNELDQAIIEVRRISSNLRPSVLDDFGLVTALKLLCRNFESLHKIQTVFDFDDPGELDSDVETALYRIAQEALANIAKHAGSTRVDVRLGHNSTGVTLTVRDNGKGFKQRDTVRTTSAHGFGLITMKERSEMLGGKFEVDSAVNKGTTITINIPIGVPAAHEED